MSPEDVRVYWDCDTATGVLTWKRGRRKGHPLCVWEGAHGYLYATHDRTKYSIHHLVFAWVHGRWPATEIDHVNRDKTDNRPTNLRETTRSRNLLNVPVRKTSQTQRKGVRRKHSKYEAYIQYGGRYIYLGAFHSLEEAYQERLAAEVRYHGAVMTELTG